MLPNEGLLSRHRRAAQSDDEHDSRKADCGPHERVDPLFLGADVSGSTVRTAQGVPRSHCHHGANPRRSQQHSASAVRKGCRVPTSCPSVWLPAGESKSIAFSRRQGNGGWEKSDATLSRRGRHGLDTRSECRLHFRHIALAGRSVPPCVETTGQRKLARLWPRARSIGRRTEPSSLSRFAHRTHQSSW